MSTRSLLIIRDEFKEPIICLYKHYDGSTFGDKIIQFANSKKFVSGIQSGSENISNGFGDFVAQLVMFFKNQSPVGDVYLYPASIGRSGNDPYKDFPDVEYVYYLSPVIGKSGIIQFFALTIDHCGKTKNILIPA